MNIDEFRQNNEYSCLKGKTLNLCEYIDSQLYYIVIQQTYIYSDQNMGITCTLYTVIVLHYSLDYQQ